MGKSSYKLNIPLIIRRTIRARFERKERIEAAAGKVSFLYEGADTYEMKTRKGKWKIYSEANYIVPSIISQSSENGYDRFCGVYFRGGKPLTIIRGNTAEKSEILNSLKTITRKVLEQIPFLSFPKKSLTEENGLTYGIRIGLILAIFLAIFVLFDYVLIPNYPEALLRGVNISFGNDINNYSSSSKIFEYTSITGRILEHFFPPKYRHLASSMYTVVGAFVLPVLLLGFIYEIGGKIADKLRVASLSIQARGFQYGFFAVDEILKEDKKIRNEKVKIEFFNRLSARGLEMKETEFENVYNDIMKELK